VLPEHLIVPGPLIISNSAMIQAIWNAVSQTAQYRVQNHRSVLPHEPIRTTDEEKCWLTLMALKREEELEQMLRYVDGALRELDEVKKLLGIRRSQ
ncbi:hypothetical protein P692DRAFT_20753169, partial [Suillus brevipes Sb2]